MKRWLILATQPTLPIITLAWCACDPTFEAIWSHLLRASESPIESVQEALARFGWFRPALLLSILGIALIGTPSLLVCPNARRRRDRSDVATVKTSTIGRTLTFTTVAAAWLGLAVSVSDIAWQGKRLRIRWQTGALESIASQVRDRWPKQDGGLPRVGPFMSYPQQSPTTLLLLKPRRLPLSDTYVSAIEQGESGAIRLELRGFDGGVWAEWHPARSEPESFVGGLGDRHRLRVSASLGSGWHLVRYAPPEPQGIPTPV